MSVSSYKYLLVLNLNWELDIYFSLSLSNLQISLPMYLYSYFLFLTIFQLHTISSVSYLLAHNLFAMICFLVLLYCLLYVLFNLFHSLTKWSNFSLLGPTFILSNAVNL